MKIFEIQNNFLPKLGYEGISWNFLTDSSLSNHGKPFFMPEKAQKVCVCLSPAVRICRLGKTIDRKFSHRYYDAIAPALHFFLPEYSQSLASQGLAETPAFSFDNSLSIGDFMESNEFFEGKDSFFLYKNGNKMEEWNSGFLKKNIDELVERISIMNTLKIGDLILPGESCGHEIKSGDMIEIKYNDKTVLSVKIK